MMSMFSPNFTVLCILCNVWSQFLFKWMLAIAIFVLEKWKLESHNESKNVFENRKFAWTKRYKNYINNNRLTHSSITILLSFFQKKRFTNCVYIFSWKKKNKWTNQWSLLQNSQSNLVILCCTTKPNEMKRNYPAWIQ